MQDELQHGPNKSTRHYTALPVSVGANLFVILIDSIKYIQLQYCLLLYMGVKLGL
jgi:hypothetical protein